MIPQKKDEDLNLLTKNLNYLLDKNNINSATLARKIGVSQPAMHKIVTGKTQDPRVSTLFDIAKELNVSLDDLMSDDLELLQVSKSENISFPLISWTECSNRKHFLNLSPTNWSNWVTVEKTKVDSETAFCLSSKKSMEPRFPKDTILIVDPNEEPCDGDYVIVKFRDIDEATIREVIIDGPKQELLNINNDLNSSQNITDDTTIIGVVIFTMFSTNLRKK